MKAVDSDNNAILLRYTLTLPTLLTPPGGSERKSLPGVSWYDDAYVVMADVSVVMMMGVMEMMTW